MKKTIILVIAVLPLIYLLTELPTMPAQVVVHWNAQGEADRYGSKLLYVILAALPLLIFGFNIVYSRYNQNDENSKYQNKMISSLVVFFTVIACLFISQASSEQIEFLRILVILFGALFIYLGNMMNKLRINRNFGIKIPATLKNEVVWNRTHYVGGYGFVLLGLVTIISSALFSNPVISLTIMITLLFAYIIYIVIYAEILYRKQTGHSSISSHK